MSDQTFNCPNCGGQIPFSGSTDKTVRCPFCDSTVVVPKELRSTAVQPQIVINPTPMPEFSSDAVKKGALAVGGFTLASVMLPIIIACVIMAVVGAVMAVAFGGVQSTLRQAVGAPDSSTGGGSGIQLPQIALGFASVTQHFGSEGIGPGQFKDARHVGVDANGNIYVGEYEGGRVQVFDKNGKYQTEWSVDRKMPLTGFAVSRSGSVFIAQSGKITQHDGQTGKVTGTLSYSGGDYFDKLWLNPNGSLVTAWYDNSDDIVVFDPQGNVTTTITAAISTASGDSELDTSVAADGEGNIYAMGSFNNAVFKFSPEGKFLNRFGSEGDGQGQFRALLAIAVDGQGRVYVADFKGVQVFSPNGQYQNLIDVDGPAYGLSIDDTNHLWVAAGKQIFEYTVNQK